MARTRANSVFAHPAVARPCRAVAGLSFEFNWSRATLEVSLVTDWVKRALFGPPIRSDRAIHERLTKTRALAVFSSDALSSVAYGTEEILLVLAAAGAWALHYTMWISIAVAVLLVLLGISYRQTVFAYPSGGGSYIVAKDNVSLGAGLVSAAALLTDYVLTVAVSVSAGVAAVTSAFPSLVPYQVDIALAVITLITLANLRGVRDSANIFSVPTYLFLVSVFGMLGVGFLKFATGALVAKPFPVPTSGDPGLASLGLVGLFVLLRAFSSGCSALTGVEAISNGIPAFRPPESRNAALTLTWMVGLLGSMFIGVSLMATRLGVLPEHGQTVLSLLGRAVFGQTAAYYVLQVGTAAILFLAANTSYQDFPRLASILARDGFLPRQFANLSDRLVFGVGIVALGVLSGLLVSAFHAQTHALIPMYAVGVFLAFTLSQFGMFLRFMRCTPAQFGHALVSGIGSLASSIALIVLLSTKFVHGAWIVTVIVVVFVGVFRTINNHYKEVAHDLRLQWLTDGSAPPVAHLVPPLTFNIAMVPLASLNRAIIPAIAYAKCIAARAIAVHVASDEESAQKLRDKWDKMNLGPDVKLVILKSPYRKIVEPFTEYLELVRGSGALITVIIPEFVPALPWQRMMHNRSAARLRENLLYQRNVIVTSVPFRIGNRRGNGVHSNSGASDDSKNGAAKGPAAASDAS